MDQEAIIQYITDTFTGIEVLRPTDGPGAGDTFVFYDPQHNLDPAHRQPFATIVTKDYGGFDDASHLNRPDVFRLNIGVSRDTFRALFGPASSAESDQSTAYDFAALDRLMPHPVYAPQSFACSTQARTPSQPSGPCWPTPTPESPPGMPAVRPLPTEHRYIIVGGRMPVDREINRQPPPVCPLYKKPLYRTATGSCAGLPLTATPMPSAMRRP